MSIYEPLGTPGGFIEVVEYNPAWPDIYRYEAERIRAACPETICAIEHIGSTSVPGLPAKPIIDIMPGLLAYADGLRTVEPLTQLGYEYYGENGIPGRHYFHLRYEGRSVVHIHMFVVGSDRWTQHLLFRNYLRVHPETVAEYEALKRDLALRYRADRVAYTDSKAEFILSVIARARAELEGKTIA